MDIHEKITKELAVKYGYLPGKAKEIEAFIKLTNKFAQYIGNNKYYSDAINKRVALLTLDADILILKAEGLRLVADDFYSQTEMAMWRRKPVKLDAARMDGFKKELACIEKEALALHDGALKLLADIRKEYTKGANE